MQPVFFIKYVMGVKKSVDKYPWNESSYMGNMDTLAVSHKINYYFDHI